MSLRKNIINIIKFVTTKLLLKGCTLQTMSLHVQDKKCGKEHGVMEDC